MANEPTTLGQAYLDGGNYVAAQSQAEKALALCVENDEAWRILHNSVRELKGREASRNIAQKWFNARPETKDALNILTLDTILLRKNKEKSKALMENFTQKYPEAIVEIKIMNCFYEAIFGDKNTARAIAREIRGDNKSVAFLLIFEGLINYEADCCREAYNFGKEAVQLVPEDAFAWRLLAMSAFRELRFNEARRAAKTAQQIDPTVPGMQIIKTISPLGWFPVFFLGSLVSFITLRITCALKLKGIARSIVGIGSAYAIAKFALVPLLNFVGARLTSIGLPDLSLLMLLALLVWLFLPEILFRNSESDKEKKAPTVKLKEY